MKTAKILIVDDDRNILSTLRQALESEDYEVDEADSGKTALALLETGAYDCVLLDLRLPDIDGLELLRRKKPGGVVMITAHGTIENAVEAMKLGCVDYLRKPFDLATVRHAVSEVLGRKDLSREQAAQYDSLIQVAKLEVQERHFRKAIEKVKKALELKPESTDAYNILGALQEVMDELPLAIEAYRTALRLDPNNSDARENLDRLRNLDAEKGLKLRFK